ncbi:hypothetical protein GCM10022393_21120 [Aquimarina addita]|uniref:SpoVT-AbrB domain-containing protein n=1 Tax=Aquimarina addita TaxID=870485 RepID=A0ABP6UIS3_9FLAO
MNVYDDIENIKSVNVRSIEIKRRLILPASAVKKLESYLKINIDTEVLILNTNIGMEVYYASSKDYSYLIKESILLHTSKHIDVAKLRFRNHGSKALVYQSFCEAFLTFAQYPQIFLAYTKKFIHLRENHVDSQYIMPILNHFFESAMRLLASTGKVPHYEKISKTKDKSQESNNDENVIKNLISEILLKKHQN